VLKGVIVIVVGLASTVVLAFASYQSKSGAVRVLFWIALLATAGVIVYSGFAGIRSDRDLRLLKRDAGTVRRFDVAAVVTLAGDWKSTTPPDFSRYLRTGERGANLRIELKTKDADIRWVEFIESSPPKIVVGQRNSWVLDYTSQASVGSWVLGVNRDDLQTCGTVVMRLYGIDYNATQDGGVTVDSLTLSFYVNGIPAGRCEYHPNLRVELTQELGSPVRIELYGPVAIKRPESPIQAQ
jgi:hypothetical protein